jgi:hypothetical protein
MCVKNADTSGPRNAAFMRSIVDFTRAATSDSDPGASSGAPVSSRVLGLQDEPASDTRCVARFTADSSQ